jgi:hypothetical protein
VAQELHQKTFASLTNDEQQAVRADAEKRYIAHAFLRQSGAQHANLKMDLQNDYTTGDNRYPKNCQQTLHLLDKYSKTTVSKANQSSSLAQKGGKGKTIDPRQRTPPQVRQILSIKNIGTTRHVASVERWDIQRRTANGNDEDDTKSCFSQAKSVKKLEKEAKIMKKAFAQLKETKEDSDISESDSSQVESHFQVTDDGLQFTQVESELEPRIAQLFKQAHRSNMMLDLREIILLDSQSTMDLICNPNLVKKIFRYRNATEKQWWFHDGQSQGKNGWLSPRCMV